MRYTLRQYAKLHGVTKRTVWNWIAKGMLNIERTPTNRVIVVEDNPTPINDHTAIYARVSSAEDKNNLERQKQRLLDYCAAKGYTIDKVVTEIGSGLNDKRPKLEKLLLDPSVKRIVVEHQDRFARFGINYIAKLMQMQDRTIEVINQTNDDKEDLMRDFVSIITSFCSRLYGLRRSKRQTEKIIKQLNDDAEGNQDTALPN